ncbi:MAG TPA: DNA-3-methyladenine glycosylase [Candidatus Limnocylindria bacterium]
MTVAAAREPAAEPRRITDRAWFDRPSAEVAPNLLGMLLIHDTPRGRIAGRIVEVEAYQGPEDLAAHSSHGRTERNAVMFGPPGHLYVYLVYGLHHCANVVCGPGDKPEAVLLRAAEIVDGLPLARQGRGAAPDERLAAGPGNLGAAFGLDRSHNGVDLLQGPVWLADGPAAPAVETSPRVGVGYAGNWASAPLRYSIRDDPHRSRR